MKKRMTVFLFLCLAMMFVCSCQNGDSTADVAGGALYKVNLSVELPADGPQRTISVNGGSVTGELTYWYKATPNWTAGDAYGKTYEIVNDESVHGFVQIEDYEYEEERDLGYFQQGQWTFDVQVRKASTVIYAGSTTVYINAEETPVEVDVTRGGAGVGTGTIAFGEITAARVNATLNLNKVVMEYGLVGQAKAGEQEVKCPSRDPENYPDDPDLQNLSFVIAPVSPAAGNYWVKLTYYNNTSVVGRSIVNFTLDAGETATIAGTLEEGVFQTALITITGISSLSLSNIIDNERDGVVTFRCEALPADDVTYQWFINGVAVDGATSYEYTWTPTAYQNASITCTATRGNIVASKSITYKVTELPPPPVES